ncbi:MAG: rhodanese-like domain-containing protein [Planctomycetota bacterium]|jgi:rhodanese-related sulfurtransferase
MTQTQCGTEADPVRAKAIVFAIIVVGGLAPLIYYWFNCGRVPMVTPQQARQLLREQNSPAVLVDTKSSSDFAAVHIDGALNWPLEEILDLSSPTQAPSQFRDKTLLLISGGGRAACSAARHLIRTGFDNAKYVRGGTQEWIAGFDGPEGAVFDRFKSESGRTWRFPTRLSPLYEQLLAVVSGFAIKPAYTLLSLILAVILWRRTSPDLVALRWSMICFFIGENFCAANYVFFTHTSYLFEYLHSFGMLLSFAFVAYALFEGMDRRILMLSDPNRRCAAQGLCRKCIKYEDVPCGLKRTFFMIIPALAFVAIMPVCADWHYTSYNTVIFGTFYNYAHPVVHQQFEALYCPIAAVVLLTASLLILYFKKDNPMPLAKIVFAAGIGPLGFGMFRTVLNGMYSQNLVWFNFWEEATELLFIVAVCFILWLFRASLFRPAGT